jgi:predicted cupin superfamily sugar epimerase
MVTDDQLISDLSLVRHPEGGWFRRTYKSAQSIGLERGERACASSILYFLKANEISCLHQLQSDEIWYFHSGSPLKIHQFASGHYSQALLGTDFVRCNQVQHIIDAGMVFGAECMGEERGTLISCMGQSGV